MILDDQRFRVWLASANLDENAKDTIEKLLGEHDEREAWIKILEEENEEKEKRLVRAREIYRSFKLRWKGHWPKEWQ